MKTLQANNLQQTLTALKAVKDLDEKRIAELENNYVVRFPDRKMYHLVLVRRQNNPTKEAYDVSFMVQQYNKRGFEKIKKGFGQFGYSQAIILHNPELLDESETPKLTTFEKTQINNSADVKALEEKHKKEVEALKKQLADATADKKGSETNDTDTTGANDNTGSKIVGTIDIENAVKAEMRKFAKDNNIDLGGNRNVEDIRPIIAKWLDDANATEQN